MKVNNSVSNYHVENKFSIMLWNERIVLLSIGIMNILQENNTNID